MNITKFYEDTIANGGKVWVFSDLHLLKKAWDKPRIVENTKVLKLFKAEMKKVKHNDMVIFLGDLTDDTIPRVMQVDLIEQLWGGMNIQRIWVRGNNDLLEDELYKRNGWKICYAATLELMDATIVFSHTSIQMLPLYDKYKFYNVHGHMHRGDDSKMYYYHDPFRCTNIAQNLCATGKIMSLDEVLKLVNSEPWEKEDWYEGQEKIGMSLFLKNQSSNEVFNDFKDMEKSGKSEVKDVEEMTPEELMRNNWEEMLKKLRTPSDQRKIEAMESQLKAAEQAKKLTKSDSAKATGVIAHAISESIKDAMPEPSPKIAEMLKEIEKNFERLEELVNGGENNDND
jgi:calcineurin-like phosphoesterase family protein